MSELIGLGIFVLTVAFGAGGAYAASLMAKKQLNGLGARVNKIEAELYAHNKKISDELHQRVRRSELLLIRICPAEHRDALIDILVSDDESASA